MVEKLGFGLIVDAGDDVAKAEWRTQIHRWKDMNTHTLTGKENGARGQWEKCGRNCVHTNTHTHTEAGTCAGRNRVELEVEKYNGQWE